jgi:hypothetical protein
MGEEAVLRDEFTFELETACEIVGTKGSTWNENHTVPRDPSDRQSDERFIWRATADESVRFLRDTSSRM